MKEIRDLIEIILGQILGPWRSASAKISHPRRRGVLGNEF